MRPKSNHHALSVSLYHQRWSEHVSSLTTCLYVAGAAAASTCCCAVPCDTPVPAAPVPTVGKVRSHRLHGRQQKPGHADRSAAAGAVRPHQLAAGGAACCVIIKHDEAPVDGGCACFLLNYLVSYKSLYCRNVYGYRVVARKSSAMPCCSAHLLLGQHCMSQPGCRAAHIMQSSSIC